MDIIEATFPFHAGEQAAQRLAGVSTPRPLGNRRFMPDQHRTFFALLPYVFIAARDASGWPVAAILAGEPGFISSPDPVTLAIANAADAEDPIVPLLSPGARFGLLGLDLSTRRRNRANGHVSAASADGLRLAVEQSFGNCPQYIHLRDVARHDVVSVAPAERFEGLDAEARAQIAAADTFFVASGSADGLDISHRGGPTGFVRVEGDGLSIPDYRGNRFFNTFGNLLLDPRCTLLFIDFARGDTLVLQGRAAILWDEKAEGAERRWRVEVARGWRRRGALPLRWTERAP